jgi:hypothetical protein
MIQAKALLDSGRPLGVAAESLRGARKGSISLGEAVKMAEEAAAAPKPAKGRKKKEAKAEEKGAEEPAPAKVEPVEEPKEKLEEDAASGPAPQKSLFEF